MGMATVAITRTTVSTARRRPHHHRPGAAAAMTVTIPAALDMANDATDRLRSMFFRTFIRPASGAALLALVACSGSPIPTDASDIALDQATVPDVVAEPVVWPPCTVPAVQVAGTTDTDTLADSPARCGQAAHRWLRDSALGTITGRANRASFPVTLLRAIEQQLAGGEPVPVVTSVEYETILYVTQDRGQRVEATALVAWPTNIHVARTLDVLLLLHGTAGFTDACAPSSTLPARALAALFAQAGYVVVAPDFLGMRALGGPTGFPHPYLVGQATAIASLDAVRAATRYFQELQGPVCASARFASVGPSQGGHATLWVDRIAPYYARELTHVGAVASVPPADLVAEANRALQAILPATGFLAGFFGTAPYWYGLGARLNEIFVSPYDVEVPGALATTCSPMTPSITMLSQFFQQPLLTAVSSTAGIASMPTWGCLFAENSLPYTTVARLAPAYPGYGLMYLIGSADELLDTAIQRNAFHTLCSQGVAMSYLECTGASHAPATIWALPEIMDFLRDRFAGTLPLPAQLCPTTLSAVRCRGTPP